MNFSMTQLTALAGSVLAITSNWTEYDFTQHVNPLIGTGGPGHVFPGATTPFGMVKPGPDTEGPQSQAGFNSDGYAIHGFSQLHDDGTGGAFSLGNFPLFPYNSCKDDKLENCKFMRNDRMKNHTDVKASPGYFSVEMDGIKAEMTSTRRTALHRYTFEKSARAPVLNMELADLQQSRKSGEMQVDKDKKRITGNGVFAPSFGPEEDSYKLYFCADVKGAEIKDQKMYFNTRVGPGSKVNVTDTGQYKPQQAAGALLQFDKPKGPVEVRVGVSYLSVDQACQNSEDEAGDWDFDQTHKTSKGEWNEYLKRVRIGDIKTHNKSDVELFYSSLYRTMINPQNMTGENPLWDSGKPHYTSFYCIWDIFRTNIPLWGIVCPEALVEMTESLLDIQEHEGWLPDCRLTTNKGWTQGGSNADNWISDVYLKGIGKDKLDWEKLYKAMVRDAEDEPPEWTVHGRGGLQSWKNLGYIPAQDFDILGSGLMTRSASRTMEYAFNDFCISQVAKGLGKTQDCKKYLNRSNNWKNLWNKDVESLGQKGFIMPRFANGTWELHDDPRHCAPDYEFGKCYFDPTGGEFYEASSWTYSLLASHDFAGLIDLIGKENVPERLDTFFHKGMQDVGDEIGWMNTFLGHYIGNTSIATDRMRELMHEDFSATLGGLPDNDDSGAMGAFVVFNAVGAYPNAGQDVLLITSPFLKSVEFDNEETGRVAKITAPDLSDKNIYIQSAKMDGKEYNKAYVTHEFFKNGHHLELVMGDKPSSNWPKDLPPSVSKGDFDCE